jgi:hypothetical protein
MFHIFVSILSAIYIYLVDASLVELQKGRAASLHSALADWLQTWEGALQQVVLCGEVQC